MSHETLGRKLIATTLAGLLGGGVLVAPAPAFAAAMAVPKKSESKVLNLSHKPLACVSTEVRPLVDARVTPTKEMERSYVYFRAAGTDDFYYVLMRARADDVLAELPRPLPGISGVEYYVEALDKVQLPKDTPNYVPPVTEKATCKDDRGAVGAPGSQEGLTIGLTRAGQDPVPRGFNKADIAKIILVSGAVVALAEAIQAFTAGGAAAGSSGAAGASAGGGAAAGGGGLPTIAYVGIGAAVAGGVAVAATSGGSKSSGPSPTPTPTPNRNPVFTTAPTVSPTSGTVPLNITARAAASDPDNDPVTITWTFGPSGATATGAMVTYTYQTAGTFMVSATASDGRGGSVTASAGTVTASAPSGPQFSAALVSWSGSADLNVRVAGPNGIDVATQSGGRNVPAGCGMGNRTESVLYQGTSLPAGSYTVFVKHADSCGGTPTAITFSYTVQSTAGMKCGGFGSVNPNQEVTACTFTLP